MIKSLLPYDLPQEMLIRLFPPFSVYSFVFGALCGFKTRRMLPARPGNLRRCTHCLLLVSSDTDKTKKKSQVSYRDGKRDGKKAFCDTLSLRKASPRRRRWSKSSPAGISQPRATGSASALQQKRERKHNLHQKLSPA